MEKRVMAEYFVEPRLIVLLSDDRTRILCINNCTAHTLNEEIDLELSVARTEIRHVPANSTTLSNPLDQLLLHSFKS